MQLLRQGCLLTAAALAAKAARTVNDANRQPRNLSLPVGDVFQFPSGGWPEALAFRPNGKLLVNLLNPEASTYQIDVKEGCAKKVATIDGISALYGITEVEADQFYVAGGRIDLAAGTREIGSFGIWHYNLTAFDQSGEAVISQVSSFSKATLNGMWTLDAKAGLILVTDSTNGVIYRVNVRTGKNKILIDDPVLKFPAGSSPSLGPNGIEVRGGYLYATNTALGTFNRIPISPKGMQIGPGEVVARNPNGASGGDDWVFDKQGNAFVGENPKSWVSLIRQGATTPQIITSTEEDSVLQGPTCARFGVSREDVRKGRLYIGDNGGVAQYSGNLTRGGGVYYIDTAALKLGR